MDSIEGSSDEIALGSSQVAKRHRDDHLTLNMEPPSFMPIKFATETPGTEFSRPPKKFAGDIQFSATQDLKFEQMNTDYKLDSKDSDQGFCMQQFSKHTNSLIPKHTFLKAKGAAANYCPTVEPKNCPEAPDEKVVKHPETPLRATKLAKTTDFENHLRASTRDKEGGSRLEQHGSPALRPESRTMLRNPETAQPSISTNYANDCDISAHGLGVKPFQDMKKPSSQGKQADAVGASERIAASESEQLSIPERLKGQIFPSNITNMHRLPSSPSLKPTLCTKQPVLLRTTKLTAIKENQDSEDQGKLSTHKQSVETDPKRKDIATERIGPEDSADLSKGTSVIPYDSEKVPDRSVSDAELELCTQWLNKERSTTLDSLKHRSEQAKTIEATLCQELEQMLTTTKQILQNELEFSVRLCSIRGQCLLFQESTRLSFQNIISMAKIP